MEIPFHIGNLSNIKDLILRHNQLTGRIPSSIQKLTELETLDFENNLLTGEIPSVLFNIKGLKDITLNGNDLTWNKNAKIVSKCMLVGLSMNSCGISGEIPNWISTQKTLYFSRLG